MQLNKRTLIIIAVVTGILLISSIIFVANRNPAPATEDERGYVDPGSGETIKNDKDPNVPEEAKRDAMIFPGFSKLIERGLSTTQVQNIQMMLSTYSKNNNQQFEEVSLQVDSIRRRLPQGNSRTHTLTFNITVNRTDVYYVTAEFDNTDTVKSTLYKADKTTRLFQQ